MTVSGAYSLRVSIHDRPESANRERYASRAQVRTKIDCSSPRAERCGHGYPGTILDLRTIAEPRFQRCGFRNVIWPDME